MNEKQQFVTTVIDQGSDDVVDVLGPFDTKQQAEDVIPELSKLGYGSQTFELNKMTNIWWTKDRLGS